MLSSARWYSNIFKFTIGLMGVDFLLNMIWLPIGVSQTYGFRTAHEAFLTTCAFCQLFVPKSTLTWSIYIDNGTGAPAGWNWILSFLFCAGTLTGFDASGHIAEETKNASVVAARGILSSAFATGFLSFITIIVYLFCTPPIDTWLTLGAPQPFVQVYALALGRGGAVVMTVIAVVGLVLVRPLRQIVIRRLLKKFTSHRTQVLRLLRPPDLYLRLPVTVCSPVPSGLDR